MTIPVDSSVRRQKKNKSSLVVIFSIAGFLLSSGLGVYFLLIESKYFNSESLPGADFIPQDALLSFSLTTDPSQWKKLRQFGTLAAKKELDKNLSRWVDTLLNSKGYDFHNDIQPWVGNRITFVVLTSDKKSVTLNKSISTNGKSFQEPHLAIILPIKNLVKAQRVLSQKLKILPSLMSHENSSERIFTRTVKSPSGSKLFTAFISQKFLVVANNPSTIQQIINAYKSKLTIANINGFAENFSKVRHSNSFIQFYFNIPASVKITDTVTKSRLPTDVLTRLQDNQGLVGSISLKSTGIQLQGISWLNPNSQRQLEVEHEGENMAKFLPPETLIMLSGSNLHDLWLDYVSISENNPFAPISPEQIKTSIKDYVNLDLEQDILSWMVEEFSVSMVPNIPQEGKQENFHTAILFIVKVSDHRKAETFFTNLDNTMRTQYQFQIKRENINGNPAVTWISPFGNFTATHGWLDHKTSFFVLGNPITNRIISPSHHSLANSRVYKNIVSPEPNLSSGQLFIDIERGLRHFSLPNIFPNQNLLLDSSRLLGITSRIQDSHSQYYRMFVELKKNDGLRDLIDNTNGQ